MANGNEKLSLEVSAEQIKEFQQAVLDTSEAIEGLADAASRSGFDAYQQSAEQAGAALKELSSSTVRPQVQTDSIDDTAEAADRAAESIRRIGDSASEAAAEVSASSGRMQSSVGGAAQSFDRFSGTLQTAVGAFIGIAAFSGVERLIAGLSRAVSEGREYFIQAENATLRFGSALSSMGKFSTVAISGIREFASELQNVTVFGDDAIVAAASLIAQLGRLEGEGLQRATRAAVQLSAVLGTDLQNASLLVAKAAQGETSTLSRYGLLIDQTVPKAQRFEAVLKLIEERFSGAAEAQARGASGAVRQLGNAWSDFLEALGSRTFPQFETGIRNLTQLLGLSADAMQRNKLEALDTAVAVERLAQSYRKLEEAEQQARGFLDKVPKVLRPDVFLNFKESDVERQLEDLELRVGVTLRTGDVDQIEREIALLTKLVPEIVVTADDEDLKRVLSLIAQLRDRIGARVQLEIDSAVADLERLRRLAEPPIVFESILQDQDVRDKLEQLQRPVFKFEVDASEIPKSVKEKLDELEDTVRLRLPEVEDTQFLRFAEDLGSEFADSFAKGTESLDPQELYRAMRLGELRLLLSEQAGERIPFELKIAPEAETAQRFIDEFLKNPLTDAQREAQTLGRLLSELLQIRPSGDATAREFIDAEEFGRDVSKIGELRTRLEGEISLIEEAVNDIKFDPAVADAVVEAYKRIQAAIDELIATTPGLSEATLEALQKMRRAANQAASAYKPTEDAAKQAAEDVTTAFQFSSQAMQGFFNGALDAMFGRVETFADAVRSVFEGLIRAILAQFAKLAALEIAKRVVTGGVPTPGAGKVEIPDLGPTPIQAASSAEFDRLARIEALLQARAVPVVVRVEEPERQFAAQTEANITINATDGVSVRRQLTSGALRSELERELKRSRFF